MVRIEENREINYFAGIDLAHLIFNQLKKTNKVMICCMDTLKAE